MDHLFEVPSPSGAEDQEFASSSDLDLGEDQATMLEPPKAGMTPKTKNLFFNEDAGRWEERMPEIKPSGSGAFALIARRERMDGDTDEFVFRLHSITVQSPLIKAQLGPVFADYKGINTNVKKLCFVAPFHEFFYRWTKSVDAEPPQSDSVGREHYKLLFDILSHEIAPHIEHVNDMLKNHAISYDYLWALFEPETEIFAQLDGHDRLFLLDSGKYEIYPEKEYIMTCRFVDTKGDRFGYSPISLRIRPFKGLMIISELRVLPSSLKSGVAEIRSRLTERGRKFDQLLGLHYKSYSGVYSLHGVAFTGSAVQYIQDGRMIIDSSPKDSDNGDEDDCDDEGGTLDERDEERVDPGLAEVQAMQLATRQVRKRFRAGGNNVEATLNVDSIGEIVWNTGAFDKLVLAREYKQIVWAFVDAQLSQKDDFDDVIKGKGKSIIMLLSGEPGTGKTLAAESVSEAMKKPLYNMSAGELGSTANEIERRLVQVIELSTKWGAVVLLDECDVFLERRSTSDLQRNKLVAVFLRLLEYYEGVLFLTTNRVEEFDPAFESRIHLTINYPYLDATSRRQIWRSFIMPDETKATGTVTESDLDELAGQDGEVAGCERQSPTFSL